MISKSAVITFNICVSMESNIQLAIYVYEEINLCLKLDALPAGPRAALHAALHAGHPVRPIADLPAGQVAVRHAVHPDADNEIIRRMSI